MEDKAWLKIEDAQMRNIGEEVNASNHAEDKVLMKFGLGELGS